MYVFIFISFRPLFFFDRMSKEYKCFNSNTVNDVNLLESMSYDIIKTELLKGAYNKDIIIIHNVAKKFSKEYTKIIKYKHGMNGNDIYIKFKKEATNKLDIKMGRFRYIFKTIQASIIKRANIMNTNNKLTHFNTKLIVNNKNNNNETKNNIKNHISNELNIYNNMHMWCQHQMDLISNLLDSNKNIIYNNNDNKSRNVNSK